MILSHLFWSHHSSRDTVRYSPLCVTHPPTHSQAGVIGPETPEQLTNNVWLVHLCRLPVSRVLHLLLMRTDTGRASWCITALLLCPNRQPGRCGAGTPFSYRSQENRIIFWCWFIAHVSPPYWFIATAKALTLKVSLRWKIPLFYSLWYSLKWYFYCTSLTLLYFKKEIPHRWVAKIWRIDHQKCYCQEPLSILAHYQAGKVQRGGPPLAASYSTLANYSEWPVANHATTVRLI